MLGHKLKLEKYQQDFYLVGKNGLPTSKRLPIDFWGKTLKGKLNLIKILFFNHS